MAKQTIQQAKDKLESLINEKLSELQELTNKCKSLYEEVDRYEKEMSIIAKELEPVKYLVLQTNPTYETLLESLK